MSNDKKGKAKPGNKLPKEAVKFAKSMGLDLTGLEPEAEDIWRMLNNMAEKDSIGYHEFVRQQMEAAKAEDVGGKAGEGTSSVDVVQRSFRPKAGFCVSAFTCDGDGLKVRDLMGDGKLAGKVLYINFCMSEAIEVPVDRYGKEIQEGRLNADGLSIPLAIGKQRDIENSKSIAIDVVVHPRVLDNASTERVFRRQLIELGLDWIQQETGLRMRLNTAPHKVQDKIEWKDVEDGRKYVGGRGDDEDIPVLFMVEYGGNSSSGDVKKSAGSTDGAPLLASPASLLSQLERETTSSSDVQGSIRIPGTAPVPAAPCRGKAAVSGTGQSQQTNINNINNNNNNNNNNNDKKVDLNFLASNSARNNDDESGSCFVGRDLRVSGTGKKQGTKSKLIQVVGAERDIEDDYNSDTNDIVVDDSLKTSTSEGSSSKSSKEDESFESIFKNKVSTKGLDLGNSAAVAVGSNKQAGSASAFGFGNDKSGKSSKSNEKAYAKPTPKESREMDMLLANLDSDEAWLAEPLTREAQSSSQEEQLQQSISYLSDLAKVLTPGVPGAVNAGTGGGTNNHNNSSSSNNNTNSSKVQEIVDSLPYKLPDVESISSSSLGAHKGGARGGVVGGIVVDPSSSAAAGNVSSPKGLGTLSRAELMAAVEAINRGQLVVSNPFQSGSGFASTMPSSSSSNNNNSCSSLLKASAELKLVDITADMNGSVQLAICIEGFVSTLDTSKLDLQVSGDAVRIRIAALSDIAAVAGSTTLLAPHGHSAHSSTSNSVGVGGGDGGNGGGRVGAIGVRYLGKELNFDPKTTKASFKKKKGQLTVTINTKFRN